MTRTLSGIKPTGHLQLGNLLSAVRPLARASRGAGSPGDVLVMVADLHALTVEHDPARLRRLTREAAGVLLAGGVDPRGATVFVQSQVPEHRSLHYLLEAVASVGEAGRMIQYKEKARAGGGSSSRLALLTYPVLMAADILLYDVDEVPVGDDQMQHLELARALAQRANARYAAGLTVPRAVQPPAARRLRDLADPARKMEKTTPSPAGVLFVLDPPEVVRRKVMRAVTDAETGPDAVRYDPVAKPGVSNLLELLAACTGVDPAYAACGIDSYAELKERAADTVVSVLEPVRAAHAAMDDATLTAVLADGADRARALAAAVVRRLESAMGL
jgi:tryptophanyl-tRNA synthetase